MCLGCLCSSNLIGSDFLSGYTPQVPSWESCSKWKRQNRSAHTSRGSNKKERRLNPPAYLGLGALKRPVKSSPGYLLITQL